MKNVETKNIKTLPPGWKKWVAENTIIGIKPEIIAHTLQENGFNRHAINTALKEAQNAPYIAAAKESQIILKKREWLLLTLCDLASLDKEYSILKRKKAPKFETFVERYYSKNMPGLFSHAIDHWPALKLWSPDYFEKKIGAVNVEVQDGREKEELYERISDRLKKSMTMREFIKIIRESRDTNNLYMTANNHETNKEKLKALYREIGNIADNYLDQNGSPGMLWFGAKGTITPAHHDLTNNIFVQIYGEKKLKLTSSLAIPHMYNDFHVYSKVDMGKPDIEKFPNYSKVNVIECIMKPGDALFIPIGWWHRVESLSISISMTFTNFRDLPNNFHSTFPRN